MQYASRHTEEQQGIVQLSGKAQRLKKHAKSPAGTLVMHNEAYLGHFKTLRALLGSLLTNENMKAKLLLYDYRATVGSIRGEKGQPNILQYFVRHATLRGANGA